MSVRRSLNQYSRPAWWKSSADFSDLNDLNMGRKNPLYPFGSNSLKTRVRAVSLSTVGQVISASKKRV